jgi:hypothetical protein
MRIASKYCAWSVLLHANLSQRLRGRTVDIVVGAQQEVFSVHERLVRASSSFFDKAMAGDWKESQQRTIHLPDDEPEIFALYVHWLYYGTLPVFCDEPGLPGNSEYLNLVKAYVLGDKILDSRYQDEAIDAIVEKCQSKAQDGANWFPVGEVIRYAFDNTNESAPIRELLVDMYAIHGKRIWLQDWAEPANVPQPFLFKLATTLLDWRNGAKLSFQSSRYHAHRSDEGNSPTKLPSLTKA